MVCDDELLVEVWDVVVLEVVVDGRVVEVLLVVLVVLVGTW